MSKSFSNSSLGRDLPPQPKLDPSRMGLGSNKPVGSSGLGQMGQGSSRVNSLMDLDSASKMGQQRSRNMMSSGSSAQSSFRLGGRGPGPLSQSVRESDQVSSILASFGLSSSDLDELSRFPEDKITAENLPEIIQHLKRKRSEKEAMLSNRERLSRDSLRPSSDNWDDLRSLRRAGFDDRPSGLNPLVDYGHGGGSRELSYRERLDIDNSLRARERLRDDPFAPEHSLRSSGSDYNRLGYGPSQERSMFENPRGMPSGRNIDDFHGLAPKGFPHLCSLCEFPVNNFQSWDEHVSGRLHKKQRLLLLELYPTWKPVGMGGDPFMLQRSSNPSPGIMGPPPPQMSMGGPGAHPGHFRGHMGMEGMPGSRPMPKKQGGGKVVHVVDFERKKDLKPQLLKLVEPFGTVADSLILNSKNEAFIEMSTPAQAKAAVNYYEMNPARVFGKSVRVFLSLKYKQIKKDGGKPQQNVQPKPAPKQPSTEGPPQQSIDGPGHVVRLCNLPKKTDYSDGALVKLAKTFGKVKNYIIMRKMHQAFVEMEKAENARYMVDRCAHIPLVFKGKELQVLLSQKYKTLVLRIPNDAQQKKNRKRNLSSDGKGGAKKQRNEQAKPNQSDVVTTEEADVTTEETDQMDLVTDSCDPELHEEEEDEDDEEAAGLLETSGSGDEAEVPNSDLDRNDTNKSQSEAVEPISSTTPAPAKAKEKALANIEGFLTLDEIENEEDAEGRKIKSSAADGSPMEGVGAKHENGAIIDDPEEKLETDKPVDYELGPYQPNVPTGVEYVIPRTGYYCRLCSLFYTNADMAKVTHCSSLAHYQKLKDALSKRGKNPETNTE